MANQIHPTAVLEGQVELGEGNNIGPFVHIIGPVFIGDNNLIHSSVIIGASPEIRNFELPSAGVRIGDSCVIRESAQIHSGSKHPTYIGSHSFIMNQVYIAHDVTLGEGVTIASSALLAGGVSVGSYSNIGMGVTIHQGRNVDSLSMLGMGSIVTKDVPPAIISFGNPATPKRINKVGLIRFGFKEETIVALQEAFEAEGPDAVKNLLGALQPWDLKSEALLKMLKSTRGES